MTVSTAHSHTDLIREAQLEWLQAEFNSRAAFAFLRLEDLDRLSQRLTAADCFDAAYAIWDDYIDGLKDEDRGETSIAPPLFEQASIFARVSKYLPPHELHALARAAWGTETFEVFTRANLVNNSGKLGWYRGDQLCIVTIMPGFSPDARSPHAVLTQDLTVWMDQGRLRHDVSFTRRRNGLALHPIFARVES